MARKPRDFAAEYVKRVSRVLPGTSRQAARGHGFTPERPIRSLSNPERYERWIQSHIDAVHALARTKRGAKRVAQLNAGRMAEGKAPIYFEEPPDGAGIRSKTWPTLSDAEEYTQGIPDPYRGIYASTRGWVGVRVNSEGRRRRRAA